MRSTAIAAVLTLLITSTAARAQGDRAELVFTLSYTTLESEFDGDASGFGLGDLEQFTQLDDVEGIAGEIRWTRSIFAPQLRIGSAVSVALFEEEGEDVSFFDIDGDEKLLLITPELQLSWRQPITRRFYIEAGAGVGIVIANYQADGVMLDTNDLGDVDEWAAGFGVRPFVRAGYAWDHFVIGAEASYRFTDIEWEEDDFEIDGELDQLMVGGFVGFRF
jgi:hypothetical protein